MHYKVIIFAAIVCLAACKGKEQPNAESADIAYEKARIRLEQTFTTVDSFTAEGLARVTIGDSATYVDSTGKALVPNKYNVQRFYEGLGLVEDGEKGPYYYIDSTGKKVIELKGYTNAFSFGNGYAVVANDKGLYGMIDKTGKEVIPCIYDEGPQQLKDNAYIVHPVNGGKRIIDIKGGTALPLKDFKELYYDAVNDKYALSNDSGWYLISNQGTVIKKIAADGVLYPRDGVYVVNRDSTGKGTEWALMNGDGSFIVPFGKYNSIDQISDGVACVGIETGTTPSKEAGISDVHQKVGYIDKTGKEVIPLQFEDIMQPFTDGLAPVMQKGKIGYIDKTGAWVIQPQFDKAGLFSRGYAKVTLGDNTWYIDKKGNKVLL